MNLIPDEGERVRPNRNSENFSDFTCHKKYKDTDTSSYNRLLNALKKLYTSYKPTIQKIQNPGIEVNYKVKGDTRVIPIVKHEDD